MDQVITPDEMKNIRIFVESRILHLDFFFIGDGYAFFFCKMAVQSVPIL